MALKQMGVLLLLLITVLYQTVHAAPLSFYLLSSFTSPEPSLPFNHITINNITGDVYIGARERLYQLNSDLTLKNTVNVGSCGNTNDNKLLLVAPLPQDELITCASCDGFCEKRNLMNISHVVQRKDPDDQNQVVETTDIPTIGAIVLGADLVGNGMDTPDRALYLFTGVGSAGLPFISKHNLVDLERIQRIPPGSSESLFRYITGYEDYLFYFISREDKVYLGRLCPNSSDEDFASYTEIELQCGSHNDIQSAYIGQAGSQLADSLNVNSSDATLYAIFSKGMSSALCFYKMSVVQQSFEDAVLGCIEGDANDKGTTNNYLEESMCRKSAYSTEVIPDSVQCTAHYNEDGITGTYYKYASGNYPLSASPIITIPDVILTSIVTTIEKQRTVAFMGDAQGNLHKSDIVNDTFGYVYESISLGVGSVLQEMFLDESKAQLTLATSSNQGSKVLTLDLVTCGAHQTCEECMGESGGSDGDLYCGWCTLEARCTRYEQCPFRNISPRWLSYNALQCVSISEVQPDHRLPFQVTEQEINITVQQLPDLKDSYQYQCAFDSFVNNGITMGNTVTCVTPPSSELPIIPDEEDHVIMSLSIVSTETNIAFISTDFILFNCGYFTSCSSCVSSPWPCDWCVYNNRCTHDNSSCQARDTVVVDENLAIGFGIVALLLLVFGVAVTFLYIRLRITLKKIKSEHQGKPYMDFVALGSASTYESTATDNVSKAGESSYENQTVVTQRQHIHPQPSVMSMEDEYVYALSA